MIRYKKDRGTGQRNYLIEDLEVAIDLTWLSMAEPCREDGLTVEPAEEVQLRHFLLLDFLRQVKDNQ